MTTITQVDSLAPAQTDPPKSSRVKNGILIAVSIIFMIGMIVTYAMNSPWLLPFLFFSLALAPLYPLGKMVDNQRDRILD